MAIKKIVVPIKLVVEFDGNYESIRDIEEDIRHHCINMSGIGATDRELRVLGVVFGYPDCPFVVFD